MPLTDQTILTALKTAGIRATVQDWTNFTRDIQLTYSPIVVEIDEEKQVPSMLQILHQLKNQHQTHFSVRAAAGSEDNSSCFDSKCGLFVSCIPSKRDNTYNESFSWTRGAVADV